MLEENLIFLSFNSETKVPLYIGGSSFLNRKRVMYTFQPPPSDGGDIKIINGGDSLFKIIHGSLMMRASNYLIMPNYKV